MTAFNTQYKAVRQIQGDIFGLQEVKLTEIEMLQWRKDLEAEGVQIVFGRAPPSHQGVALAGGVAVLSRGRDIREIPPASQDERDLREHQVCAHCDPHCGG